MEQHPGDTSTTDGGQEGDGIYPGDQKSSQEQDSPAETEKLRMQEQCPLLSWRSLRAKEKRKPRNIITYQVSAYVTERSPK